MKVIGRSGTCSDLGALGDQVAMFGEIASGSTARRVPLEVGERERARAGVGYRCCARPGDPGLDATLITAHSDKQQAAGNYKGG